MGQISTKLPWSLAQTKWPATINPILAIPFLSGNQLNNVVLKQNVPLVINHLLQRMQQGWFLTDNTANVAIWRTQPFNNLTLTLEASDDTTISLWVF